MSSIHELDKDSLSDRGFELSASEVMLRAGFRKGEEAACPRERSCSSLSGTGAVGLEALRIVPPVDAVMSLLVAMTDFGEVLVADARLLKSTGDATASMTTELGWH